MTQFTIPEGAGDQILAYVRQKSRDWTVAQMLDRVAGGLRDLEAAAREVPEAFLDLQPAGEEWTPRFCIQHVAAINMGTASRVASVAATGRQPREEPPGVPGGREEALALQREVLERSFAAIAAAPEDAHLTATWLHPLLGELTWREWLLTLRVHCLAHAGQLAAMAAALRAEGQGKE